MSQARRNKTLLIKKQERLEYYRINQILVLIIFLAVAYLGIELFRKTLYSSEIKSVNVEIEGTNLLFTEHADIVALMNLKLPFMQQNVAEIGALIKRYPWLNKVEVRKYWPDKIIVKIDEYQPVASWNQHQLLNVNGFNFSVLSDKMPVSESLVALFGPEGTQKTVLQRYYHIKGVVDSARGLVNHQFDINELVLGQNLDWSFTINQQIRVLLGREALIQRIERLIALYPLLLEKHGKQLESIDLRYESGAAIRLK